MKWRILFRPEVEADVNEAASWYDLQPTVSLHA